MLNILRFLACFVFLALQGCQTSSEGDSQAKKALKEPSANDEAPSPAMWSPAQRRSNAAYFFLVADQLAMQGEVAKALPLFESAYNLDPNSFLGEKVLATEAALGQIDKALVSARRMLLLYPDDKSIRLLYSQLLAKAGYYADAIAQLEGLLANDPSNEMICITLAELYQQQKRFDKALAVIRSLVYKNPFSMAGWVALTKLHLILNQKQEALDPAHKAYELQPQNPELILLYAFALELNGRSKEAAPLYEQLYWLNPTNDELIARVVGLYRQLGNLQTALDLLTETAKQPGGNRPGVQMQRAFILWEMKRFRDAAILLDELAKQDPDSDRLQYMSALGHERLNDFKVALQIYDTIKSNSQLRPHADFRRAFILKSLKRFDEALDVVRGLVDSAQIGEDAYVLGANIYEDKGQIPEAVTFVEEGVKHNPAKPRLLFLLGAYQEKASDIEASKNTMRKVIAMDPLNSSAYNFLGYLIAEHEEDKKQLGEAESLIRRALEIKPNDGYYLDSLGWVFYRRADYQKALSTLTQALALAPGEGVILEHLGDVHLALGSKDKALDYYDQALKTEMEKRDRHRVLIKRSSLSRELKGKAAS